MWFFFLFKQKTAYEMRISDWSSDVCSSDLFAEGLGHPELYGLMVGMSGVGGLLGSLGVASLTDHPRKPLLQLFIGLAAGLSLVALGLLSHPLDRKSVV